MGWNQFYKQVNLLLSCKFNDKSISVTISCISLEINIKMMYVIIFRVLTSSDSLLSKSLISLMMQIMPHPFLFGGVWRWAVLGKEYLWENVWRQVLGHRKN